MLIPEQFLQENKTHRFLRVSSNKAKISPDGSIISILHAVLCVLSMPTWAATPLQEGPPAVDLLLPLYTTDLDGGRHCEKQVSTQDYNPMKQP